jgi:hypothetical protein
MVVELATLITINTNECHRSPTSNITGGHLDGRDNCFYGFLPLATACVSLNRCRTGEHLSPGNAILPSSMPTEHILTLLISERDKLNRAIEALGAPVKRRGRPAKAAQPPASAPALRKRTLSAAGRKAIVAATKRRWALIKAGKTGKAAVAPASAGKRKPMTAAQKKTLSMRMKAAWARRRKAAKS